jgi:hypothetical protein
MLKRAANNKTNDTRNSVLSGAGGGQYIVNKASMNTNIKNSRSGGAGIDDEEFEVDFDD